MTHDFGEYPLEAAEEVASKCVQWTIGNDEPLNLTVFAALPNNEWNRSRGVMNGRSVRVHRNTPTSPWRLVNKNFSNKYNLKMQYANGLGLWGGALVRKSNVRKN